MAAGGVSADPCRHTHRVIIVHCVISSLGLFSALIWIMYVIEIEKNLLYWFLRHYANESSQSLHARFHCGMRSGIMKSGAN